MASTAWPVRPPPHGLARGKRARSRTRTRSPRPRAASRAASAAPPGPPPAMTTSFSMLAAEPGVRLGDHLADELAGGRRLPALDHDVAGDQDAERRLEVVH